MNWLRSLALPLCLLLAGLLAWTASRTPQPSAPDAPPAAFSAGRAFLQVQAIAARPHPLGSAENRAVRNHLMRQFAALGLEVSEHPGHAVETYVRQGETRIAGGDVVNVVAVLPGRNRALPALAVMSHYDSAPASPGAADDAAGVAASLEIARALKAGPQPLRDVVFLVTDGEEAGLLGARAFFESDPLADRVGSVLNMEARGGGGRAFMFQTAPGNGRWIDLFRRTAAGPSSNSLAVFLYSLMPNDTDFTVTMEHGKPGLNYAFIGRQFDYHSPSSTPANLDRGSLQHMGDQVLSAARGLGFAEALPGKAPDAVYADLFGGPIVAYPAWAGWIVLLAAAVMIGAAAWKVRPKRRLPWRELLGGVGLGLYILFVSVALFELIRRGTGIPFGFTEQRALLARFGLYELALGVGGLAVTLLAFHGLRAGRFWIPAAALALVAGLGGGLLGGFNPVALGAGVLGAGLAFVLFRKPLHPWWAWFGLLALGLLLGVALQLAAAPAAFLVHWPLLAAGVLLLVIQHLGKGAADSLPSMMGAVLIGAAGLAWLLYLGHAVVIGVGADLPAAPAVFVLLAALILFPLLYAEDLARWAGVACVALVAGLVLFLRFGDPWSARHPQPTHVLYVAEPQAQRAWRASGLAEPDRWSEAVLKADGGQLRSGALEPIVRKGVFAPATPVAAPAPFAEVRREASGRVVLRLDPTPGARELTLWVRSPQPLTGLRVNGIPVKGQARAGRWTKIDWNGPRGGLEVIANTAPKGSVEARWAVSGDGWPQGAKPLPPRPADAAPWADSDSTVTIGTMQTRW